MFFNVLQSQLAWFSAVLSAADGRPWLGTIAVLILTGIHVTRAPNRRTEAILALTAAAIGAVGDSALARAGLITFTSGVLVAGLSTPWMIALWMNFATVLNGALRSLQTRVALAPFLGALAGPLAYTAGVRLGALQFTTTKAALACIALEWAIALPILCAMARRLRGTGYSGSVRSSAALSLLVAATLMPFHESQASDANARRWSFRVQVDGREIGRHDFTLTKHDGVEELESHARFEVKLGFVHLYHYQHDAHETWRQGCLTALTATTDDNGTRETVQGSLLDDGSFRIESQSGSTMVTDCVRSFAYWDINRLKSDRLLNPQSGRYEQAQLESCGVDTLTISGAARSAGHYRLHAAGGVIDLWYSDSGDWLRLRSNTPNGKTLTYDRT